MSEYTELIGNLARTRAMNHDLIKSQARLLKAIDVAYDRIRSDERIAKDQVYVEILSIFDKAIDGAVEVKP